LIFEINKEEGNKDS